MTDEARKYLSDVHYAISLISSFMEGVENFESYEQDHKPKSAVERQLGIIGEAVNNFRKYETDFSLNYTREIIGLRNRIIHGYDTIDESIIWTVIWEDLPKLKEEVEEGLAQE